MKSNPYLNNLTCRVFDIETTGLYPERSIIISASFVFSDGSGLIQFFTENPQDEPRVLKEICAVFRETDVIFGYNSDRFDIPFLVNRLRKYGLEKELPAFWSIDVYQWLKHYWPMAARMEHLNQKSVEIALGLSEKRTDPIDGGQCIELYSRYLNLGETAARDAILLHNGDDVRQLGRITEKCTFLPYHQIAFERGFMTVCQHHALKITKQEIKKNSFVFEGKTEAGHLPTTIFTDDYQFEYDEHTGKFKGQMALSERTNKKNEKQLFIDLKKLPVDCEDFSDLAGYYSGYMILQTGKSIAFREANQLANRAAYALSFNSLSQSV